tara:strand:- start:742 stop:1071 length:330 start_codon:yes stop_codon:yes gene_type:complete
MSEIVDITESAYNMAKSQLENDDNLRLQVKGGGCSGMSYELFSEEADKVQEIDTVIDYPDFKVVIDQKSLIYLKGLELDYEGGLEGSGFRFSNPNAVTTCGCGESFSVV